MPPESSSVPRSIGRSGRDGSLYPGSDRTFKDFIGPGHLRLKIDANFDLESLCEFLAVKYNSEIGQPAVHPEVLTHAVVLPVLFSFASYPQLCERIAKISAWW